MSKQYLVKTEMLKGLINGLQFALQFPERVSRSYNDLKQMEQSAYVRGKEQALRYYMNNTNEDSKSKLAELEEEYNRRQKEFIP